jgi:hypothetical protein
MTSTTTPAELRAEAARHDQAAADSFERCDTDGFMSQWASGLTASKLRLEASIQEKGGKHEFPALFDLDGELVAAKLIDGKYGPVWGILASDDPHSNIVAWVGAFPKRESTLTKKGYREGEVFAPARAELVGANACSVHAVAIRTDGGFSRDVEVLANFDWSREDDD